MKILSISNNLLSLNNPNGKFCRNYLHAFSDDELASFYISNDKKREDENIDVFNVTDSDILQQLLRRKNSASKVDGVTSRNTKKKSSIVRLLRYCAWRIAFRRNIDFFNWIEKVNPTHICLTIGDNPFLFYLARYLAKKGNCKLIIICGENYALKKYNYLSCKKHRGLSFLLFQNALKKQTKKCFKISKLVIFNSNQLQKLYKQHFKRFNSIVCFPLSTNEYNKVSHLDNKNIVYAGNLGVGRAETLLRFAQTLSAISKEHDILVYGSANKEQQKLLKKANNIKYCGLLTNDELIKKIDNSWLSLHIESFEDYRKMDLEYAFSTKISDLISSNDRFFMYSPDYYVESKFFIERLRNHVALSDVELREKLKELVNEKEPFSNDNNESIRKLFSATENGELIRNIILNL